MGNAKNIKVLPMRAYYGEDLAQVEKIICHADSVATPLNNKYFYHYIAGAKHVYWFNVGDGGTAPTGINDATLHEVEVAALATAAAVATALAAVMTAVTGLDATASNNEVTATQTAVGYSPAAYDGRSTNATLFGFEIVTQGDTEAELGLLQGEIEVTFAETLTPVPAHESGTTPVASLKTGVENMQVTLNLLETTKANLKRAFVQTGGSFTPDNGTEVFGMGTFKQFSNMMDFAKRLRLHPVARLAGDRSEDWTFWKAIPQLSGINFSGEGPLVLPFPFLCYPDATKDSRVNYLCIGDSTQTMTL